MANSIKDQEAILAKLNIYELNPMQEEAIKVIKENTNVILLSPTGTGKTLAFSLPLINSLDPTSKEIQALILVPSRELAIQIEQVIRSMGSGYKVNAVYGGRPMSKDKIELKHTPAILIGTPGRVADHFSNDRFSKNNIKTIATFHNVYGGSSYFKKMYNKGLSKMDHLVAISDYVKEIIVKKYDLQPNNISVINRGVDTEYFNQTLSTGIRDNIINTHQIDTAKKIILFPARITSWKGQLEFIDVIKKMDTQNIIVLFAGDTKK